jgi:hypothetical protein
MSERQGSRRAENIQAPNTTEQASKRAGSTKTVKQLGKTAIKGSGQK